MPIPEEHATKVAEFAVARLHLEPGDVLVVKVPEVNAAEMAAWRDVIVDVLAQTGHDYPVLVMKKGVELDVLTAAELFDLHTLSEEALKKAGAGGWAHDT